MSAAPSPPRKKNGNMPAPPRRGKIKAQIFESLKKTVVSAVTGIRGNGTGSPAGTPPASAYNSDANSDKA